jgi:hypothetical protein
MIKKKKKSKSKWGMVIQYLENDEYLNLNSRQNDDLLKLRSLKHYVDDLNDTIERDSKIVQKLQKEIKERREKIRIHTMNGKPLFERLEHLKNEHQIVVYYTEGVHKRKKVEDGQNGLVREVKDTVDVEYKQINLKYRSIHLSKTKTVYLKPRRSEILDDLKVICPNWYERVGEKLRVGKDSKIEKVRIELVELFTPILKELITTHSMEINNKDFSITYKVLLEKLKEKGL